MAKKTHRGIRSPEKQEEYKQRNYVTKYLFQMSYNDHIVAEKVSQTSRDEIYRVTKDRFGYCFECAVPVDVCLGIVLSSSIGDGLLQV